jgi:hypothetical protein
MQRPWRIVEVWQKTLYIVIGYALPASLFFVLRTWLLPEDSVPYALLALVLNLGYTFVGVRVFRGYLEPVAPPRAWWRWTGRPRAGFWLCALHVVALLGVVQDFRALDGFADNLLLTVVNTATFTILAAGYLFSSFRLQLHPELWSHLRMKPLTRW